MSNFIIEDGLTVVGNISGNYIYGDGSNLTGIPTISAGQSSFVDENVGDNIETDYNISHNLNANNVVVSVKDNNTKELVIPYVEITDGNNILLSFSVVPTTNQYSVTIIPADFNLILSEITSQTVSIDGLTGGEVVGNILPSNSGGYDLGSLAKPWRDLYLTENSLRMGNTVISVNGGKLVVDGKEIVTLGESLSGAITTTGNISAGAFYGDGSNLSGVGVEIDGVTIQEGTGYIADGSTNPSTTDITEIGFASASSDNASGVQPFRAFNDVITDNWISSTSQPLPQWVQQDFGTGNNKTINKYRIRGRYTSSGSFDSWTLEASKTGAFSGEEVVLDTRSGEGLTNATWSPYYTFSNDIEYMVYRIVVTATDDTFAAASEIEMIEAETTQAGLEVSDLSDISTDIGTTGNISGSAFYGSGANLTGIIAGASNVVDGTTTGVILGDINNNVASGNFAVSEGKTTEASGNMSHSEGYYTTATGNMSHAEGWFTTATGNYGSHAEGTYTTATEYYSHAEGSSTLATGRGSHSEGIVTTASGDYSHAEGRKTTAYGVYSHAGGRNAKAKDNNSFVWSDGASMYSQGIGTFNIHATNGIYLSGGPIYGDGSQLTGIAGGSADFSSVGEDIVPSAPNTYSLGTSASPWKDLHVSNSTIYIGETTISAEPSGGGIKIGDDPVVTIDNTTGELKTTAVGVSGAPIKVQTSITVDEYESSSGNMTLSPDVDVLVINMTATNDVDITLTTTTDYKNSTKIKRLGVGTGTIQIFPDGSEDIDGATGGYDATVSETLLNNGDLLEIIPYSSGFILG